MVGWRCEVQTNESYAKVGICTGTFTVKMVSVSQRVHTVLPRWTVDLDNDIYRELKYGASASENGLSISCEQEWIVDVC